MHALLEPLFVARLNELREATEIPEMADAGLGIAPAYTRLVLHGA